MPRRMPRFATPNACFAVFVVLAVTMLLATPALAQCPPGFGWFQGRCRPVAPMAPPPAPIPPVAGPVKVVTANALNVRACPSVRCGVVTVVYRGQRVRVLGFDNGFHRIAIPGQGPLGWASARFLSGPVGY